MGPFIKDSNTTKKMMKHLLIALTPIIIFAFIKNGILPYKKGYTDLFGMIYPLVFISVPVISTFAFEILFGLITKKNIMDLIRNSYGVFPGLFLGLILPLNTPLYMVVLGSLVASIIAKMIFGGFGKNIFNPALVGRLFIISLFASTIMSKGGCLNPYELDAVTSSTPLTNASVVTGLGTYETLVKPYGRLLNMFIGNIPGTLGETSALLCLLAFVYLTYFKVIKWRIPATYILTVFAMTYVIGGANDLGIWYPLFQIFTGGLMFGAVFMATDPVTSPVTPIGQTLYGMFLGILTVVFRYLTPFPEGVLTSILTMNMLVMVLDKIGAQGRFNLKITLIPFVVAWLLIIGLSMGISLKYKTVEETDPNFNIVSKETNGTKTTYVVTQKGYAGNIKAQITINDNIVEEFKVLEHSETFYSKIEEADYINKLKQDSGIDTISGATFTSSALKKMLINTLNDYNPGSAKLIEPQEPQEPQEPVQPVQDITETVIDEQTKEYVVTNKGFQGDIKLKVTVTNKQITNIEVLEQTDSFFNKIEEANYINLIIENQNNLDGLDAVSGATFSSNGVKGAVQKVKGLINE